ncbi:unnamed protein product [Phytophthora fragariaefolia]|uniref:Unnamed protein product n=1 Tax=Phytophthora fragariaefolia TaxID=1490495 RepID=A0A9W6TMS3_9STRA|nr:unnamed protein product [Phytophthora fragariaefolia]
MKYYAILRRQRPNPPSSKTKRLNPPSGNTSMVTTRSQAAAARAASQGAVQDTRQDRQASEVVTAIVETALVAIQGYAESGLKELATRLLVMAQEFQGELAPIRSSLQQQSALLQKLQTDLGAQMKGEVSGMLNQAIRRVQQEMQSALEAQTQGATQLEKTLYSKVETGLKDVVARVQQQIEEQLTRRLGANPSKDVELLVNKSTSAMETRIETLLHRRINGLLTSKLDSHSEKFKAENVNVLVHKLVDTSVSDLGNRLEQSLDLHLEQIREKMQHKLDSNPPLHETFTDDIQQLVAQETTWLVRQAESRLQKASNAARADVNVQVQRQADALTILREQLQLRRLRSEDEPSITDALESKLKAFINDEVARQVDSKIAHQQSREVDRYQQLADLVGVELRNVLDERQTRTSVHNASASAEIKQTVENSIQAIIATVRDAVNYASSQETIVAHETSRSNQPADTDCDEDDDLSEEDRILQRRMREALVRAQTNFNTRIKEEHIQNADTCPTSVMIETTPSTRNTSSENRTNDRQRPIRGSTSRGSKYRGRWPTCAFSSDSTAGRKAG